MDLRVDHVTVAGRDLESLSEAYTRAGLTAEYGGKHSNGVTHMAVVGFGDGSYLELISALDDSRESPWWDDPIRHDGGPCGWAVGVDDIETASERLRRRGVAVDGPHAYQREREDGHLVEWQLTFLGDGDPGHTLPFLIEDETPRARRVSPTGELASEPITGVERVVLAVRDRERASERFRAAFDLPSPEAADAPSLDADLAVFPDSPVVLAAPAGPGWLRDRLDAFGPRPAAVLLGGDVASPSLDVVRTASLGPWSVSWVAPTAPLDRPYLGVIR